VADPVALLRAEPTPQNPAFDDLACPLFECSVPANDAAFLGNSVLQVQGMVSLGRTYLAGGNCESLCRDPDAAVYTYSDRARNPGYGLVGRSCRLRSSAY